MTESSYQPHAVQAASFETKATDFLADLGDAARRNPVSTALIGMGLLWLVMGGKPAAKAAELARRSGLDRLPDAAADAFASGRSSLQDGVDRVTERLSDVTESAGAFADTASRTVRDRAGAVYDSASRYGSDLVDAASDYGRGIPDQGKELLDSTRSKLSSMLNDQPLLLGALGIAIGAGIAASFPATQVEAAYLGEFSDELKESATAFATGQTEQIKQAASEAVEEARRQGFSTEGLKTAAADVGDKVKRVVESSGDAIRQRAE
jgi:ElaB/YqjD/DUF883 family membrane-anchored ribosome-binding protein